MTTNIIIILLLVVLIGAGIRETVKHFKGEGACCGGSTYKPKKKKLKNPILHTYAFRVDGMQCQNCVNAVTRAVNDIDGAAARVNLAGKSAKVQCDRDIAPEIIMEAIRDKGYEVHLR